MLLLLLAEKRARALLVISALVGGNPHHRCVFVAATFATTSAHYDFFLWRPGRKVTLVSSDGKEFEVSELEARRVAQQPLAPRQV